MMTKEEAIKNLKMQRDLLKFNPTTGEEEPWRYPDEIEALDMAIGALEGNTSFVTLTFDKDEMQRSVDKAKEEIKTGIIAGFIDDLNEIFQELWDVDIPSPTVPEYIEHHEQIQGIMAVVKGKIKKYKGEMQLS